MAAADSTTPTADRSAEIRAIVAEETEKQWAEQDRHGSAKFQGPWYRWDMCRCGYQAPRTSKDRAVSVGVHVHMAKRKAQRAADAEIARRVSQTAAKI